MLLKFPIPGYEGLYSADIDGNIWRDQRTVTLKKGVTKVHPARMLNPSKPDKTRGPYYRVGLTDKLGNAKSHSVHRLVAMAFHPNPHNKRTVNHKDGNGLNNRPENLEWATDQEQVAHAWRTGLQPHERRTFPKSMTTDIQAMHSVGTTVADIARHFNIHRAGVRYHLKKEVTL